MQNSLLLLKAETQSQCQLLLKQESTQVAVWDAKMDPRFQFLQMIRQAHPWSKTLVIGLGQHLSSGEEEAAFFAAGGDQWLAAPWSPEQILLRLKHLGPRMLPSKALSPSHPFAQLEIFPEQNCLRLRGQTIQTTPIQMRLLATFLNHPDQLLSRAWLKESVWQNTSISPRSIDAQISKLKKLLPELENHIANIYGKGYVFSSELRQKAA